MSFIMSYISAIKRGLRILHGRGIFSDGKILLLLTWMCHTRNCVWAEVDHITTRIFSYGFVLGVSGDWLSVSPRRGMPDDTARIVYAY